MSYLLFASDLYLIGLALTVALVVYPSFHLVGDEQWSSFHRAHVRRMVFAVAPAWFAQCIGSLWWLVFGPCRGCATANAAIALVAIGVTIAGAIPAHHRLERRHDSGDIQCLQMWHWLRTGAWIGCALVTLRML